MDQQARQLVKVFRDKYLVGEKDLSVLEIGSMNVNGMVKDLFTEHGWDYMGVDKREGENVDILLTKPHPLPLADDRFDVCVSTSVMEHDPKFWVTFDEMVRVVKPEGLIYINAPSSGPIHRGKPKPEGLGFIPDCWRFLPDCWDALRASCRTPLEIVESYIYAQSHWKFNICVFKVLGKTE